jgi:hypothetical protein
MQVQLLEHVLHAEKENEIEKQQRWRAPISDILIQQTGAEVFIFWGKTKDSRWVEQLESKWMNENKLELDFRKKLIRANKTGRLMTLPWDLSTQTPRRTQGEIQAGASLLQVLKTPVF